MFYYKKLNAGPLPFPTTPEGRAMGHIPGWVMLLDPAYLVGTDQLRNRALKNNFALNTRGLINLDTFDNGAPAFRPTSEDPVRLNVDADINPDAWTVFTVARYNSDNSAKGLLTNPRQEMSGVISPQIGFSQGASNAIVWENSLTSEGQPQRLSAPVNLASRSQPALLMVTFSTADGLKIFDNGGLIAEAPDDRRPLNYGFAAGQWDVFHRTRSRWGMTGILNIDLGSLEHTADRRAIERFLMQKYGIA